MLHHLTEPALITDPQELLPGACAAERVASEQGTHLADRVVDGPGNVEWNAGQPGRQTFATDARQDRVDEPVQAGDLGDRLNSPLIDLCRVDCGQRRAISAVDPSLGRATGSVKRRVGQQVQICPHHRQRSAQLVRDDGQQFGPGTVERHERFELLLRLGLEASLLDGPTKERTDRDQELDLFWRERARLDRLNVDDAGDRVVPGKWNRKHGHELRLVKARNPLEARVHSNVWRRHRQPRERRPAGQPFAWGQRDRADLVEVKAVGGGQPEAGAIALHQVDGADLDV